LGIDQTSSGPDFSDTFTPTTLATTLTFETNAFRPCGISFPRVGVDSPGRVVFFSFPFDTVPTNGPGTNNAVVLMRNIVQFLAPGLNGVGEIHLDSASYTTNALVTVEMADSDLVGAGQATVTFGASSRTNRTTITVLETTHPGMFRGYLTLVAGVAATNQLRVQNADILTATYFDASRSSNVTATAVIDTVPPGITNVAALTDVVNALVTWDTTEPADSAVQYSESPLPDRVVYTSQFVTNHAITINGLAANRVYYYQVVSTDPAGNTTVDDNQGNLYTFTTLPALRPPWFDNLESGATNWTVVPDPQQGSDINWTLGTPNNGLATSANSGINAWGSDLNGDQSFFLASTFLYTPFIDLSGLVSATLTVTNVYDFSRVNTSLGSPIYEEDGGVFVSTNSTTPPSLNLPLVEDLAGNVADTWQPDTFNLTPFVGQTIQVVFYYQAANLGDTMYGWTLDDVSITGVTASGNVVILKNLGQGAWSLSSVSSIGLVPVASGVAPSVTVSNLAVGQYAVQFGDVQYYHTPPDQTNTVTLGSTLTFTGNYTFEDINSNGIPDNWERDYFGEVTTNRTRLTDTDHSGMSDYGKFMAGLDPTNPASRFWFNGERRQSNGTVMIQWTVATNRLYQVVTSTNFSNWQPVTPWMQATDDSPTMNYMVTNRAKSSLYRVQVQP
jgi:hypothetical protein